MLLTQKAQDIWQVFNFKWSPSLLIWSKGLLVVFIVCLASHIVDLSILLQLFGWEFILIRTFYLAQLGIKIILYLFKRQSRSSSSFFLSRCFLPLSKLRFDFVFDQMFFFPEKSDLEVWQWYFWRSNRFDWIDRLILYGSFWLLKTLNWCVLCNLNWSVEKLWRRLLYHDLVILSVVLNRCVYDAGVVRKDLTQIQFWNWMRLWQPLMTLWLSFCPVQRRGDCVLIETLTLNVITFDIMWLYQILFQPWVDDFN